jgi:NADPH-dependent ferric siderophore reductase
MARPYAAPMSTVRTRREPPSFRKAEVARAELLTPHLRRITLTGPELAGLPEGLPAASVRLLLPRAGEVVLPEWNGNEFRYDDGARPPIRSLTPRRVATEGAGAPELDVDIVLHGDGTLSRWAASAEPGAPAAVAGTGRGYTIDPEARRFVLAGDETALPAIAVLLEALPPEVEVRVVIEVARPEARLDLPAHPGATVTWHDLPPGEVPGAALVPAVLTLDELTAGAEVGHVWAAGEAAAVQRIRRHLFEQVGFPRSHAVIRGYWKHGRSADAGVADGDG